MKKNVLIIVLLGLLASSAIAQVSIWNQRYLSGSATMIEKIDDNTYQGSTSAIGRGTNNNHSVNVFRTYFVFDLSQIPTNVFFPLENRPVFRLKIAHLSTLF